MLLRCQFEAAIEREAQEDYVREAIVDVADYDEHMDESYLVGRMSFLQILWSEAEGDGIGRWEICDAHSSALEGIFIKFMDEHGEIRPEFDANEAITSVIVLDRAVFHAKVVPHVIHILAAALDLFGWSTLVVIRRDVLSSLNDKQLAALGFRKAADSSLIYRHSALRTRYGNKYPRGKSAISDATPEQEEWVLAQWEKPKRVVF